MRLTLALLILTALVATQAMAEETKPLRTISVSGVAQRKIIPDEAHILVNLSAMETTVASAKSSHDAKLKKLLGILKSAGVEEKKISTQSSGLETVYKSKTVQEKIENASSNTGKHASTPDYENKTIRVLAGYRMSTVADVTLTDTAKLGKLLEDITGAGFEKNANKSEFEDYEYDNNNSLISTYYTVSNREKISQEMLQQAVNNAKAKATMMATAAGTNIARVMQMSETSQPGDYPRPNYSMKAMASLAQSSDAAAPPAGEQEVTSTVSVVYELKD